MRELAVGDVALVVVVLEELVGVVLLVDVVTVIIELLGVVKEVVFELVVSPLVADEESVLVLRCEVELVSDECILDEDFVVLR